MSLWRDNFNEEEIKGFAEGSRNRKAEEIYDVLVRFKDITFEEGDFLLRHDLEYNYETYEYFWVIEKFSEVNQSYRKYKVVYVDEVGLPYVKKVLFNGDLCGEAKCLAGYDLDRTKFLPDPDFMDHHLLAEEDEEFDPLQVYKEKRVKRKVKNGI